MFSHLRILYHFLIWPIPSYLKEPPCTLRTPSSSVETIQHYTLWRMYGFDITSEVFSREANKCTSKWKPMFSHLRILYHFLIWPIPSYLKEPPCTQSTPSSWRCSQWEQINTTLWRNKNKYECMVGYNFRSFQGRPTNLYPNESLCSPL